MPPFLPASGTVALLPMGNFDIDLDFGLIHEDKVKDIFQGKGSIEVKTERDMWSRTGNMAVEITYKGKPSGITITDAKWWCHLFTIDGDIKFVLMMRVKELKERIKQLARTNFVKIVKGGDNDDSEIILVPIQKVVGYTWK
jgi:hypothetical protein|tara:strand:+ start:397 stop:819 length:423 start_codon:yes stop_codon:yes gene_type:complete